MIAVGRLVQPKRLPLMRTLADFATIQAGYQARKAVQLYAHGSHLLIQGRDLEFGRRIDVEQLARFNPEGDSTRFEVRRGDVLFQSRGANHYAYYVNQDLPPAIATGSFFILRPYIDKIHPGFLAWWINQTDAQSTLAGFSSGTKIPLVQISALKALEIPDLAMVTQRKIAGVIEQLQLIENLERRLQERRASLVTNTCINAIEKGMKR